MTDKYIAVPQGKVFIASRDASGMTSGFTHIGDCDGFSISTSQDYLDIYESMSGNRNIVAHIPTQSDYSMEVSMLNIDGPNLAKAFYGESAVVAGASVTNEAVTCYNGEMTPLKYPGVSSVTVTKTAGSVPLVLNTDYTLDATNGTITILAASTVVAAGAGVPCTVNYTHAGVAARAKLMTAGLKDYTFRFEGKSKFDDKVIIATVHRVAMDMAATMSLIGTGVNKLVVGGKLLPAAEQVSGESQYFTVVEK